MSRLYDGADQGFIGDVAILHPADTVTVFCWVNFNGGDIGNFSYIDCRNSAANSHGYILQTLSSDVIRFLVYAGGFKIAVGTVLSITGWQSIGGTYDKDGGADQVIVYQDGADDGSIVSTSSITYDSSTNALGYAHRSGADTEEMVGQLSYCAIWDRTLTSNEMAILDKGINPFHIQGLVGMWPLDGNNDPEGDYSLNQNTCDMQGDVSPPIKGTNNPPVELLENCL